MLKSIHSRHNEVLLGLLRSSRVDARLRQTDLALRLGREQAVVSKVERGERRLDVIELRAWLLALDVDFLTFLSEFDRRLRQMPVAEIRPRTGRNPTRPGTALRGRSGGT